MRRSALLSECGRYRWWLSRTWGRGTRAVFVMLNPSTADAEQDDPTIRRCMGFARSWGMAGVVVVNLYAWRSTDPKALWTVDDPVGESNDLTLAYYALGAADTGAPLVAAWGAHAKRSRVERVLTLPGFKGLHSLGVTKAGQPRHPLYLRADAELAPWPEVTR